LGSIGESKVFSSVSYSCTGTFIAAVATGEDKGSKMEVRIYTTVEQKNKIMENAGKSKSNTTSVTKEDGSKR